MEQKNSFSHAFYTLAFFVLFFRVLSLGANVIVPFFIAVLFAFAIIGMSDFYKKIRIFRFSLPPFLSMLLSLLTIVLIFWIIVTMLNANFQEIILLLPSYQEKIQIIFEKILQYFHFSKHFDGSEVISQLDINQILTSTLSSITAIFSQTGLISVYVLFILWEYRYFSDKIQLMINDEAQRYHAIITIDKIKSDIKSYFLIKTIVSFVTWVMSYLVMWLFDLDFALFWAMLIFLLNFIPNIGSFIAVCFPLILSLVQYESYYPFFFLLIVLSSIQILMGNIIEPRFMGNRLNLSPLVIIMALGFWGTLWGIIGMLLCVPIMVIVNIILSKFPSTRPIAILLSEKWELTVQEFQSTNPSKSDLIADVRKRIEIISKMNR